MNLRNEMCFTLPFRGRARGGGAHTNATEQGQVVWFEGLD
jgi:hypothetical protein